MNNMFDILELCLQEVQNGTDLEAVLSRYPEHVEELRPLLVASVHAKHMAVPAPSEEVVRRSRTNLLQQAAQMREGEHKRFHRFVSLQRWVTAFALLFVFLFAGTRLIAASADALPGDGLYPAKRVVENVSLWLTFDAGARDGLRVQFADERLREVNELLALGISARVDFAGVVTGQRGDAWQVAGIPVFVTSQTQLPGEPVQSGAAVRVYGVTRGSFVLANRIEYLPAPSTLSGFEAQKPTATPMNTRASPATATPSPAVTPSPSPTVTPTVSSGNSNTNSNRNTNQNDNDDDDDDNDNGD